MKISAQEKVPQVANETAKPATPPTSENTSQQPTRDRVGKTLLQDPLRRMRDHLTETSAHKTSSTGRAIVDGLKVDKCLGLAGSVISTVADAAPKFSQAHAQDGTWMGPHAGKVAGHIAYGTVAGMAGGALGAEVGEVAGAFIGGAFGGVGAIPGAVIGGIIGEAIGSSVAPTMAFDDYHTLKSLITTKHG